MHFCKLSKNYPRILIFVIDPILNNWIIAVGKVWGLECDKHTSMTNCLSKKQELCQSSYTTEEKYILASTTTFNIQSKCISSKKIMISQEKWVKTWQLYMTINKVMLQFGVHLETTIF